MNILSEYYLWIKSVHIISVIAWMAAMLYLPRLFVYHTDSTPGGGQSETFKVMEGRLLKSIMTPAMIGTWVFGLALAFSPPAGIDLAGDGWFHAKLAAVVLLSGLHGYFAKTVRLFADDRNERSATFYRVLNEVPTVLMVAVVIFVVVRPF